MSTLLTGSKGSEVQMLQRALSFLGYSISIDGDFGNATAMVVIKFQADHHLNPDGIVGLETWESLDQMVPQGIDISHNNGSIDWNNLSPHIQFIYCKASQGSGFQDPMFKSYQSNIREKKLISGAYHFLTFQASAESQVDNFLKCGFDFSAPGSLPPVIDVEWQVGETTVQTNAMNQFIKDNQADCIELVNDVLKLVSERTGRSAMIYTAKSFIEEFFNNQTTLLEDFPLWIPAYQSNPPMLPPGWTNYIIWQYYGAQDASPGQFDLNIFNGTVGQLHSLALVTHS